MSATGALMLGVLLVPGATGPAATGSEPAERWPGGESAQVALDWQRVAFRTVYTEGLTPIPSGVPLLGYTSMAVHRAVTASLGRHRPSSETAAVAQAAHDVLAHWFPAASDALDTDLDASLAGVPDGPAERRGVRAGGDAAAALIAERADDGYGDPDIHYDLEPGVGVWQPTPPATDMLVPWLGSLRPLVLRREVGVDGHDPLASRAYARDYREVRRLGSTTSPWRTTEQTDTSLFFNSNSAIMVGDALVRHLETYPMSLRRTALTFAVMHASMTDSVIRCWELKRDVGFWRPFQAIAGAGDDGNATTQPQPAWEPLIANPPYSDYVSGHACLTAPAVETVRMMIGERAPLELQSLTTGTARTYATLSALEQDAGSARVWGGLHFRDAVDDGYRIGHLTARRVADLLRG